MGPTLTPAEEPVTPGHSRQLRSLPADVGITPGPTAIAEWDEQGPWADRSSRGPHQHWWSSLIDTAAAHRGAHRVVGPPFHPSVRADSRRRWR